jgi:hypothetical protein
MNPENLLWEANCLLPEATAAPPGAGEAARILESLIKWRRIYRRSFHRELCHASGNDQLRAGVPYSNVWKNNPQAAKVSFELRHEVRFAKPARSAKQTFG